jgi:hypothetical protein
MPAPRCRVLLVTDVGAYVDVPQGNGVSKRRLVANVGLMLNRSLRDAVGASFFVSFDDSRVSSAGLELRGRRWVSDGSWLDLAVGVRSAKHSRGQWAVGGLGKYNVGPYLGLALRPEILVGCSSQCLRLSAGLELGSWPALALPAVGALIYGLGSYRNSGL